MTTRKTTAVAVVVFLTLVGGGCKKRTADADQGAGTTSGENLRDQGDDVKAKGVKPKPNPVRDLMLNATNHTIAHELWADYKANGVAADTKYKGKTLCVIGVVSVITTDVRGKGAVALVAGVGQTENVVCYFDVSHKGEVAGLSKGDTVVVVGTCKGKLAIQVTVDSCRLVASGTSGDDVLNKLDAIKAAP